MAADRLSPLAHRAEAALPPLPAADHEMGDRFGLFPSGSGKVAAGIQKPAAAGSSPPHTQPGEYQSHGTGAV